MMSDNTTLLAAFSNVAVRPERTTNKKLFLFQLLDLKHEQRSQSTFFLIPKTRKTKTVMSKNVKSPITHQNVHSQAQAAHAQHILLSPYSSTHTIERVPSSV